MRPLTHDNPNAIPRNGTEVPWVDLPEPDRRTPRRGRNDSDTSTADDGRRRR